jgi:hypothetical protein
VLAVGLALPLVLLLLLLLLMQLSLTSGTDASSGSISGLQFGVVKFGKGKEPLKCGVIEAATAAAGKQLQAARKVCCM